MEASFRQDYPPSRKIISVPPHSPPLHPRMLLRGREEECSMYVNGLPDIGWGEILARDQRAESSFERGKFRHSKRGQLEQLSA